MSGAAIFHALAAFLEEDGWSPEVQDGEPLLRVMAGGKNGEWECFGEVRKGSLAVFSSSLPDEVPAGRRAAAAELVTRANWGLALGAFELSYATGELNFRTGIDLEGLEPAPLHFRHLVHQNIVTFDRYLPAIRAVAAGTAEPAATIAAVEKA